MKSMLCLVGACAFVASCKPQQQGESLGNIGQSTAPVCGVGLLANANVQGKQALKHELLALSRNNLQRLRMELNRLTQEEYAFLQRQLSIPTFVVSRFSTNVCSIFQKSRSLELRSARNLNPRSPRPGITPLIEDRLYGAFSCVFATVGAREGEVSYGPNQAVLDVAKLVNAPNVLAWATGDSGAGFVRLRRTSACIEQLKSNKQIFGGESFRNALNDAAFSDLLNRTLSVVESMEKTGNAQSSSQDLARIFSKRESLFVRTNGAQSFSRMPADYSAEKRCKIFTALTTGGYLPRANDITDFRQIVFAPSDWKESQALLFLKYVRDNFKSGEKFSLPQCEGMVVPQSCGVDGSSPQTRACPTEASTLNAFLSLPREKWHTCLHRTHAWTLEAKVDDVVPMQVLDPDAVQDDPVEKDAQGQATFSPTYKCR